MMQLNFSIIKVQNKIVLNKDKNTNPKTHVNNFVFKNTTVRKSNEKNLERRRIEKMQYNTNSFMKELEKYIFFKAKRPLQKFYITITDEKLRKEKICSNNINDKC